MLSVHVKGSEPLFGVALVSLCDIVRGYNVLMEVLVMRDWVGRGARQSIISMGQLGLVEWCSCLGKMSPNLIVHVQYKLA